MSFLRRFLFEDHKLFEPSGGFSNYPRGHDESRNTPTRQLLSFDRTIIPPPCQLDILKKSFWIILIIIHDIITPMPLSFKNLEQRNLGNILLNMAILVAGLWYVFLCLLHLLSRRPLWFDESLVFASIQEFHPLDFFRMPLLNVQVFPRVYLFLIQQLYFLFGFDVLILRLPSFVCMLGAFFIWLKIVSFELKNKVEYLTFVFTWSASCVLLYYSAELKPYSMDCLCAAVFILFLYHQEYLEKTQAKFKYLLILILLPFLVLLSYPAFLFAFLPLYNLFLSAQKDKHKLSYLFIYGLSLLIFGLISYFFDMRLRPLQDLNSGFGTYFVSFTSAAEFFSSFGEGTMNLFSRWFIEQPRILKKIGVFFVGWGMLRMVYGFFLHFHKNLYRIKSLHTIAFVIYGGLFLLGVFQKYPFTVPRTSLFYCPVVLFLTVQGIADLKLLNIYFYRIVHTSFLCFLIFLIISFSFFVFARSLTFSPALF